MKGNDGTGNIPERDSWRTNQDLWNKLDKQYCFTFDCCASLINAKTYNYSPDFLNCSDIDGCSWMNPPFSKSKEMFKQFFKVVHKGVAIYRCDNMETKVWQEIILKQANWVFIPKGRISYTSFETGDMRKGKGTRFPSALIGFNVPRPNLTDGCFLRLIN